MLFDRPTAIGAEPLPPVRSFLLDVGVQELRRPPDPAERRESPLEGIEVRPRAIGGRDLHRLAAAQFDQFRRAFAFERREPKPTDVLIRIDYCGVCHSDLHQVRNEWKGSTYPMVPGHEIVGHVERVGSAVTKLAVGDLAGVGCMVDSCRTCDACKKGLEQYCEVGSARRS